MGKHKTFRVLNPMLSLALIWTLTCVPTITSAHVSARSELPRHGGVVRESDDMFFELVAKENSLTLYARDSRARAVALSDGRAEALIWTDQGNQKLSLSSLDSTRLVATAALPSDDDFRVIVTLDLPNQKTRHLMFGPIKPDTGSN